MTRRLEVELFISPAGVGYVRAEAGELPDLVIPTSVGELLLVEEDCSRKMRRALRKHRREQHRLRARSARRVAP